jgi:hypothetical protein
MSFTESAENVRVDEGHILRASLRNGEGNNVDAEIDLDQFLGNHSGSYSNLEASNANVGFVVSN